MLDVVRNVPAIAMSVLFHLALLAAMAAFKFTVLDAQQQVAVETIFEDEREQEQFTQELTVDTEVSENLSLVSGGVVSTAVGGSSAPAVSQKKIERSEKLQDPIALNVGMVDLPSMNVLGQDLGEGEVNGEVGASVEGYGAAMSRISAELLRLMRNQPVIVVWMFDASGSQADDREEIAAQFDKIYAELGIASERAKTEAGGKLKYGGIETAITSFGEEFKELLKPTEDIEEVRAAIRKVEIDTTGKENMFASIAATIDGYSKMAARSKRKLAIVVVSDESGDDGAGIETVIAKANLAKSPIYFLSREAIFGYPYASMRVIDEKTGLPVWPRVDRGPETSHVEALQWTGFHHRHGWHAENVSSGFGPYTQVRVARESGGIFFLLSGLEEQLGGGLSSQRRYDPLAMKEYEPLLDPRKVYEQARSKSRFRDTVFKVIRQLNPNEDNRLNVRWLYSVDKDQFLEEAGEEFKNSVRTMKLIKIALKELEKVKSLRAKESEMRWRAAFDLIHAQLHAYQVQHFQFLLALDRHAKEWPELLKPDTNRWARESQRDLFPPDKKQLAATGVTAEELEESRRTAIEMYRDVIAEHPGTPWALRAEREMRRGFGMKFREHFHDPRYDDGSIKVPSL